MFVACMLKLRNLKPLAVGSTRAIYQHPHADNLLIKVIRFAGVKKRWRRMSFIKMRRRTGYYHVYFREIKEYIAIKAKYAKHPPWLQRIDGFIDTDRGLGMVVEKLKNRKGQLAQNLKYIITENGLSPRIRKQLDRFVQSIRRYENVVISDLNLRNILYTYDPKIGDRLVLVDGLGEKLVFPLHSMFGFLNRRNTREHIRRLDTYVDQAVSRHKLKVQKMQKARKVRKARI
jgi:hypothetical protein